MILKGCFRYGVMLDAVRRGRHAGAAVRWCGMRAHSTAVRQRIASGLTRRSSAPTASTAPPAAQSPSTRTARPSIQQPPPRVPESCTTRHVLTNTISPVLFSNFTLSSRTQVFCRYTKAYAYSLTSSTTCDCNLNLLDEASANAVRRAGAPTACLWRVLL